MKHPLRRLRRRAASLGERLRRRRMWRIYRRAYAVGMDHAAVHWEALQGRGVFEGRRSLFSIGPGDGELELRWLAESAGELGYAEVHAPHCRRLERHARRLGVASRIVERHAGPFHKHRGDRRYDLLLAIHSWYAFGFDAAVLRQALSLLTPGGLAVLSLSSEKDFFVDEVLDEPRLTAEALSAWASERGHPHEHHVIERRIPIEVLLRDDALTRQGRDVVAFLKGRPWSELSERVRGRALDACRRHVPDGGVMRRHGCLVFRSPHD